jgi:long-chain acyl-CoA synthetase
MTAAHALAQPFGTLPDLMRMQAEREPRHVALVHEGCTLDYGALDALVDRIAAALQRDGLGPGDAIALCGANSIPYAALFLGGLRAGVAVAPLATSSTGESLAAMVADAGARHLFLDAAAAEAIEPVRDRITARLIEIKGSDSFIHACDDLPPRMKESDPFITWLASAAEKPRPVAIRPEAAFNIIYSSGTTGTPKGIVQPNTMRWAHLQRGPAYGYSSDTVTLISTPLYSNTTLVCFFPTLALGGTVVLMAKFDAAGYLALAEQHRVTHTMLVPVQYQRLMALADFARYDLSSFRMKFSTSAPFAAALKADVLERWPGALVELYGMTEGGGTAILMAHEHPDKLHTVGQPAPGHDIRLIDDEGNEVPRGTAGEVVGHSSGMMTGYHKQPAMTAAAEWFDAAGKRFIRTGDIGRFDDDGFLVLLDRKKDMIISGGFNIYPSDLEGVIAAHPDVADVAVVGVPSVQWGETPVAFVVPKSGSIDAESMLQWANQRLGKVQRLAALQIVESLPRSAIGKVLKRELRERYRSDGAARSNASGASTSTVSRR